MKLNATWTSVWHSAWPTPATENFFWPFQQGSKNQPDNEWRGWTSQFAYSPGTATAPSSNHLPCRVPKSSRRSMMPSSPLCMSSALDRNGSSGSPSGRTRARNSSPHIARATLWVPETRSGGRWAASAARFEVRRGERARRSGCAGGGLVVVGAPVAQGIEHRFPKPCAQVRILAGAQAKMASDQGKEPGQSTRGLPLGDRENPGFPVGIGRSVGGDLRTSAQVDPPEAAPGHRPHPRAVWFVVDE